MGARAARAAWLAAAPVAAAAQPPADPGPPAAAEPHGPAEPPEPRAAVLGSFGLGAPTGLLGGSVAWFARRDAAVEIGGGLGFTGWQAAALARWFRGGTPQGLSLAGGPSIALSGDPVGVQTPYRLDREPDPDDLFYALWINAEIGYDARVGGPVFLRMAGGGALRVADNQSHLCAGVPQGRNVKHEPPNRGCNPPHAPPGPVIASRPALPYAYAALGLAF